MLPYDTPPSGGGLYVIWLSDAHFYGGRAQSFKRRWETHFRKLQEGTHGNPRMQNVFNKYGRFEPQVLKKVHSKTGRIAAEQEWLDENQGGEGCVNISPWADGGNHRTSSTSPVLSLRRPPPTPGRSAGRCLCADPVA